LRITAVQLESMEFPAEIQAAIRNKIAESQIAEAGVFKVQAARLEAERKEVEAGGIKKYQDIVNVGLTDNYVKIRGIEATLKLAESNNSKVVIFGSSPNGLPLILGGDSTTPTAPPSVAPTGAGAAAGVTAAGGTTAGGKTAAAPGASGSGGGSAANGAGTEPARGGQPPGPAAPNSASK